MITLLDRKLLLQNKNILSLMKSIPEKKIIYKIKIASKFQKFFKICQKFKKIKKI